MSKTRRSNLSSNNMWAHRNRGGKTGLDLIDTSREFSYAQGVFVRNLLTGRLRTRNPVYWLLLVVVGGLLMLPFILAVAPALGLGDTGFEMDSTPTLLALACFGLFGLMGVLMEYNALRSLRIRVKLPEKKQPREYEQKKKKKRGV